METNWSGGAAQPRRATLAVFAAFAALYLLTALGRLDSYDGEMMYRVTESLVERHSLVIRDEIFHVSEPYAVYGLAVSALVVPFYLFGSVAGVDTRWAVSLFNPVVTAATVALLYRLGLTLGYSGRLALVVAGAYGVGSLAWPYTKTFFSEPLATFFLVLAALACCRFRRDGERSALPLAGFALGAAALTRDDSLSMLPFFAIYLAWPRRGVRRVGAREALLFLAPLLAVLALLVWYQVHRFGVVSQYAGSRNLVFVFEPAFFLTSVYGQTVSAGKGLLFYTPLVVLAPFAWRHFAARHRPESLLFAAFCLERLLLFGFYAHWAGGVSWGPRFQVPMLPFLILPLGSLLMDSDWMTTGRRALFGGLAASSVLAQLPGVAVYYALYWNATINTKTIVHDQIYFAPQWSPLVGQFRWILEGRDVQWLLPIPEPSLELPVRTALVLVGLAAGALAWVWTGRRQPTLAVQPASSR